MEVYCALLDTKYAGMRLVSILVYCKLTTLHKSKHYTVLNNYKAFCSTFCAELDYKCNFVCIFKD